MTTRAQSPFRHDHYDVVVVGARCAGAATAMLLARSGHSVLLLDRARLPSDTLSTHSLARGGVVQLARWGLLDEVLATGAPAIRSVSFQRYDEGGGQIRMSVKDRAGVDLLLAPRRQVLDDVLARAAVRAGAELHDRTSVDGVLRDACGRVVGVRTTGPDGVRSTVHARLVVGADGVRSRMAKALAAPVVEEHAPSGACLYAYADGVDWDGFEFHLGVDTFAGVFPTHAGEANVWLMQPASVARDLLHAGARRSQAWQETLDRTVPALGERVRAGSRTTSVRGAVGLPNHVRQATGAGWALVGDAAYHRDPITGHGMTDSFRDAELLAHSAHEALLEPAREVEAMAGYEWRRRAALEPTFRLTRQLGAFPEPDRFTELQRELSRALEAEALELAALPVPGGVPVGVC